MGENNRNLTDAEWNVMECLWQKSPRTGRETIDWLKERMGWSRSTTLTHLRRMEAKGAVGSRTVDGLKTFIPLVKREDAVLRETNDFLGRIYKGSLSLMVSQLTQKQALPQDEIEELYAILDQMKADTEGETEPK